MLLCSLSFFCLALAIASCSHVSWKPQQVVAFAFCAHVSWKPQQDVVILLSIKAGFFLRQKKGKGAHELLAML